MRLTTLTAVALFSALVGCDKPADQPLPPAVPAPAVETPPPEPPIKKVRTDEESRLTVVRTTGEGTDKAFEITDKPPIQGAVLLKDQCDVPFLIAAMAEKGNPGFAVYAGSGPLDHQIEVCAKYEFMAKNNISQEDQKNTFKLEEYRKQYMAAANAKIDRFKAAEYFFLPSASARLGHYEPARQGFPLNPSFPSHDTIRKSAEARFVDAFNAPGALDSLEFTPVYLSGTPLVLDARTREEAEAIEAAISKGNEYYDARYIVTPVALTGSRFEEVGPGAGRRLENAYLYLKIEQAVLYVQYESFKTPMFSTIKVSR